jgi:hypothetical protein
MGSAKDSIPTASWAARPRGVELDWFMRIKAVKASPPLNKPQAAVIGDCEKRNPVKVTHHTRKTTTMTSR